MHKRDALTKRRVKHGFTLFHFHLDAHRLEPNLVDLRFCHRLNLVVFLMGRNCRSAMRGMGAAEAAPIRLSCSMAGIDLEALAIVSHRDLTLYRREGADTAELATT